MRVDLGRVRAKLIEVWGRHPDHNDDLVLVEQEMAEEIVPMMNGWLCEITHHAKPIYIFKLPSSESRFPTLVHKNLGSAKDYLLNGASLRVTRKKKIVVFEAFDLWKCHPDHLTFSSLVFKEKGQQKIDELNIFMGLEIEKGATEEYKDFKVVGRKTGREFSTQTILDHQFAFFCARNPHVYKYFIHWQAYRLQYPLRKAGVALVILSHEGIGKDLYFTRVLGTVIGKNHFYQTANLTDLAGHFNMCLEGKILVVFDEAGKIPSTQQSLLQCLITEEDMRIERKGMDSYKVKSAVNVVVNSNLQDEAILKVTAQSRRYVISKADSSINVDRKYFVDLIEDFLQLDVVDSQFAGVKAYANFLYNVDLTDWNPRDIPITETLIQNKLSSMPVPHQYIYECLVAAEVLNATENYTGHPWSNEGFSLPRSVLWDGFLYWSKRHTTWPGSQTQFVTSLESLIHIQEKRPRLAVGDASSRHFIIHIPPLHVARVSFVAEYSHVTFDDPESLDDFLAVVPRWAEAPPM